MHRPGFALIIIICLVVIVVGLFVAGTILYAQYACGGHSCTLDIDNGVEANGIFLPSSTATSSTMTTSIVDTSGWQIYNNYFYGFELKYPADWQFAVKGAQTGSDYITGFELGHPLTGQLVATSSGNPNLPFLGIAPSYVLTGSVGHVAPTSTARSLADASEALFGTKFEKEYDIKVGTFAGPGGARIGAYDAHEYYGVDHGALNPKTEQIFVTHDGAAVAFEFPVAETPADKNNASPAENNAIAREIINTLIFSK